MAYYIGTLFLAAAASVCQAAYWHCHRAQAFTRKGARQWRQHPRVLLWSFFVQLAALWGLTFAAQRTGMGAGYFRHIFLVPFLWLCTVTDWKDHVIPNRVLLAALAARAALLAAEILLSAGLVMELLLQAGGGALVMLAIMLICGAVTRGSLGAGDIKLFAVIGLFCGANSALNILMCSVVILSFYAIAALILKKATLRSTMPMAPAAFAGFLVFYFMDVLGG